MEKAGSEAVTASNSTGGEITSLRGGVGGSLALWLGVGSVGGAGGTVPGLPACVHALYYDDKRIGLWNFIEQPSEAMCTGCTQRLV